MQNTHKTKGFLAESPYGPLSPNAGRTMTSSARRALSAALLTISLALLTLGGALAAQAPQQLTLDEAKAIALADADITEADAVITAMKLDRDDRRDEIEIEFITGGLEYEYDIDATTGEIIKRSAEKISERKLALYDAGYITMAQAREKALAHAGLKADQVTFTELKLDFDDGLAEYELRFHDGANDYKVEMYAEDGEVFQYKVSRLRGGK